MAYAEKRGTTWRVRYEKPDGTYGSESGFPTKNAALKYGRKQETKVDEGKFVDPKAGRKTVGTWAGKWLQTLEIDELSEETYRSRFRAQILPRWEETALADVKTSDYKIWRKELRDVYSENYANEIVMVFRMLMDDAVTEGLIGVNPIPVQSRRRGKYEPQEEEDDYVYPSPLQAFLLAENARVIRGAVGEAMILTKAFTGMRLAELVALQREFCWIGPERDPWDQHIRVEWQGHYRPGGFKLRPPKYHSRRTLIVPPALGDLLWKLLEGHNKDHVFPSAWGKPIRTDDQFYGRFWHPIVEGHEELPRIRGRAFRPEIPAVEGLEGMVPHGARHGHRVWLEEDGIPDSAIDERMGHKVRRATGKGVATYRHVTPAMRKRVAKALQRRWEKAAVELHKIISQNSPI